MKSLKSPRLSTLTPLQAITEYARRAAANAAAERLSTTAKLTEKPEQRKQRTLTPIEMSTRSIRASLAASAGNGISLVNETPSPWSSAHAIFSLYNDAEVEAYNLAKRLHQTDPSVKIPKLCPEIKYVLFASALDRNCLGSVAIYCEDTRTQHATIIKSGHLLGIPIKSATLEAGISQYVDVMLRA